MNLERAGLTCLISGTGGYLGGRLKAAMEKSGWRVRELTRNPLAGSSAVRFQLGQPVAAADLAGAEALVHCAYDFKPLRWEDIQATNVAGTQQLLRAAREAGVRHLVYISSISAYPGCRSLYGKAKQEAESIAQELGAVIIRPGLIWSEAPGAMFGRLVKQVEQARLLPLFGGGAQVQYLVHEQDLAECIAQYAAGKLTPPGTPITVAHEQPWTFRQILQAIAQARNRRLRFLPVPWRLVWAGLKMAELCGVRLGFRSDSLVSLMYQNPAPVFAHPQELGLKCRRFSPDFKPTTTLPISNT